MKARLILAFCMVAFCMVAFCMVGCVGPEGELVPITVASFEAFAQDVQPHLTERCGSGACHGRADRPLALFAPGAHRRDAARTYVDEALSEWEIEENARRISAFAIARRATDSLVIRKPLAADEGGVWHGGGDTFADPLDPACIELSIWLDARVESEAL